MPTWYHYSFYDDETHIRWHSHISLKELANNTGFSIIQCRYSLTRFFNDNLQKYFRFLSNPWYLSEVYLIAEKKSNKIYSKEY